MSGAERGSPRRTPVRRARTSAPGAQAPLATGGGLFANVERTGDEALQLPHVPQRSGLDSGLAKACPSSEGLSQKTYRSFRRRLELFQRQCDRRGRETSIEGAFLVISKLRDVAWDATEQLSFDEVERSGAPFQLVFRLLDELYQYEDLIEVPSRCDEFFSEFQRNKGEELQAYLIRHKTLLKRMKEVNVEVPTLLSGWHLLTRAGVPRWTHVQIKAMCGGDLDYDKVSKALIRMFGGDHKPSSRDLGRQSNPSAKEETYYEEEDEIWYEEAEDWVDDWYDDEEAFEVGEYDNDDDIPEELEEAMDHADEAYVSYVESRKRMKELALARGFYPVVALGPEAEKGAYRSFKGDGKGKGKGKNGNSKGKSKGKGKGGGFLRRAPFNRRPMSGLRKGPMTSTTTASSEKSTFSGSTQQHGPRFKRYRSQAQGVKEVPEEVTMVEEMMVEEKMDLEWLDSSMEQCFFASTEVGKAIVDSGATRTIVGENNWHLWLEKYDSINLKPVEVNQVTRQFKFGGGETLVSTYEVKFTAWVHGQALDITASVVPGSTPFLLARPVLEEWGVVHDYKNGAMKIGESPWFKPERNDRGHFLLDLMMYHKKPIQEETYYQFEEAENSCGVFTETQLIDGGPLDVWDIEPAMEFTATTEGECHEIFEVESIAEQAVRRLREKRILRFFEVYVDEGNLSVHLANQYEDVEVSGFSLPEWDLSEDEVRKEFINLLREVSPDFVWLAPPCRKWSAMQRLNLRSRAQKDKLQDDRLKEEQTHLALVKDTAAVTKENGNNYACEHPHGADSWKTETMKSMKGYYEAVCDRCRTGLRVDDGHDHGPVRKQTRIRTSSIKVAEAMHLPCECQVHHVQMEGKTKQLRGMQNYEEGFVKRAAKAIYECMDESWRKKEIAKIMATEVMVTEEMTKNQVKGDEKPETHPKKAWQVIDKLHRQLGHPGRDRLVVAVRDAELGEELVKVAKAYKCDVCQNFTNKKTAKPASLPQASSFNELLEMDVFHIKWNDEKRRILAIIDIYSRYEMNAVVASETEKEELGILDQWINAFGCPSKIRADASGAHMSEQFLQYMDDRGIKLVLVPKEAHHRMGTVERLHAVRRLQLLKMKQEDANIQLETAVPVACSLRNQLRSVHGTAPAQIVFGKTAMDKGLMDEPCTNLADPSKDHQALVSLRLNAARAFYSANHSQTLRKALLSKSRGELETYYPGDWVYYWRSTDSKLEISRWRGPALVCSMTPRDGSDSLPAPSVYWLAHGSSLVRVSPECLRPEAPRERQSRLEQFPQTARVADVQATVRQALQPVRGPIRFLDLLGDPPFADANGQEQDERVDEPPDGQQAEEQNAEHPPDDMARESMENHDAREEEGPETAEAETQQLQPHERQHQHAHEPHAAAEAPAQATPEPMDTSGSRQKREPSAQNEDPRPSKAEKMTEETSSRPLQPARGRSRSPQNRDERSVALSSYNLSRQLDGLPPVQATDPVFHRYMDTLEPLDDDEMLLAEHFNEKKLTPEQRKEFDNAKDAALQVWIENAAWKAVPEEEAKEGEVVPARFLQRWKPTADGHKANARVILQGFRHKDVLSENLVKESPTLSRFGRITLMVWAVHRRWKLWCADVKSAFMQANSIDDTTRIYVKPPAEMRRRLERLMGLKSHEILKATKPAFGDVRAPRQWHETANDYLVNELGLVNHPLDRCLYLSLRPAVQEDPNFLVFESKGGYWIVDGALGLHVDDFLGAGEGVYSLKDVKTDAAGACDIFQNRVNLLSQRFRFGAWDFGDKMRFCGAEVQQSPELEVISVSLKEYVHKIKPLSMEKMRKNMQDDYCTEKEHRMLRALVGAMSWPVTQCLPQAAATISILQANINKPMVKDMLDANKCLRFMKEVVKDYTFTIRSHGDIENIRIGVYCDAAWSVRPDGSSQGGMLMFLASHDELQGETPFPLTVIDWSSKKLVRMCRSSLAAEAQSATIAVDELGWAKVFFAATVNPYVPIQLDETMHLFKESPVITDAKALYDSAGSVTPGLKLSERRTAIEISILRERMKAALGQFRWVNSLQQLADGLTKPSAKDALAHTLARGVHALKYDPNFVAAKKVSGETKEQENLEYEKAAAELFDGQVFYVDKTELKESRQLCMLPGCQKQRDMSTEGNRYCSRRHFYTHRFRQGGGGDEWQKAAKCALAILASEATVVEATNGTNHDDEGRPLTNTAMVIVLFALVGMICSSQLLKEVLHLLAIKVYRFFHPDDEAEFGYEEEPRLETSHGEIVNAARHGVREYDIAPESEEMEVDEEDEPEIVRCGPMAKERWMRLYEEVRAEAGQQNWRWTNEILWTDAVSSQMRGHVLSHVVPEKRREEYLKLVVKKDCMQVSDDEIRQWHRFLNGHFNLIVETHVEVRELRQKKAKELKDQEEDPHEVERRKFREGLLRDRQQQTYATYNHVTNEMRHTQRNGAWEHVSCYEGRV